MNIVLERIFFFEIGKVEKCLSRLEKEKKKGFGAWCTEKTSIIMNRSDILIVRIVSMKLLSP